MNSTVQMSIHNIYNICPSNFIHVVLWIKKFFVANYIALSAACAATFADAIAAVAAASVVSAVAVFIQTNENKNMFMETK